MPSAPYVFPFFLDKPPNAFPFFSDVDVLRAVFEHVNELRNEEDKSALRALFAEEAKRREMPTPSFDSFDRIIVTTHKRPLQECHSSAGLFPVE